MEVGPGQAEGAFPEDIDLYCLECGYNLRGLTGDPRRCPECFHLNPTGEAELSAELISRQLRRMESAPAVCVGSVLLAGTISVPALMTLGNWPAEPAVCCGVLFVASVFVWVTSMAEFAHSCMSKPGWFRVLMRYHAYGLAMAVVGIAVVVAASTALRRLSPGWGSVGVLLMIPLIIVGLPRAARWGYRKATEQLEPLQREVAATLARDRLRRQLSRPR